MSYQLKRALPEDYLRLYPLLTAVFPRGELKREPHIIAQLERGLEEAWFLTDGERELGYALIVRDDSVPYVLLDYLAMYEHNGGCGSACLELLKQKYPQGILAEVEADLPDLPEEERILRRRRFGFYRRAGFVPFAFENSIFTVEYLVHLWQGEGEYADARSCAQALSDIYRLQLPQEIYDARVFITVPEM